MSSAVSVGQRLTLRDLEDVAIRGRRVELEPVVRERVRRSREAIDAIARAGDDAPASTG
jgi:histidine ammonia-lyase